MVKGVCPWNLLLPIPDMEMPFIFPHLSRSSVRAVMRVKGSHVTRQSFRRTLCSERDRRPEILERSAIYIKGMRNPLNPKRIL